jgi:hypothetical protein
MSANTIPLPSGFAGRIDMHADLGALLIRKDGTTKHYDCGKRTLFIEASEGVQRFWKKVWKNLRLRALIPLALTFAAFMHGINTGNPVLFALVTTTGVNYMTSDFASGGVTPTISGFKFHDSGTGVGAEAIGNSALGTPTALARVSGTPTNPSANQYRSVATLPYNNTFAITEWGLFSASVSGTLWDRRVFSAINVNNGDSIQFTYTLTVNAGGT